MTPAHEQILNVLLGYLSAMNAEGVLLRAMREAEIQPEEFSLDDLPDILPSIEVGSDRKFRRSAATAPRGARRS
jgi:serine/threonine-protein kinase RsbT